MYCHQKVRLPVAKYLRIMIRIYRQGSVYIIFIMGQNVIIFYIINVYHVKLIRSKFVLSQPLNHDMLGKSSGQSDAGSPRFSTIKNIQLLRPHQLKTSKKQSKQDNSKVNENILGNKESAKVCQQIPKNTLDLKVQDKNARN